ncbi:MAG: fibronectin type III domain-containing protein, partial [Lachnospiraceae bacterium]
MNRIFRKVLAWILIVVMLPISSFQDCFAMSAYAAEDTWVSGTESDNQELSDGEEVSSGDAGNREDEEQEVQNLTITSDYTLSENLIVNDLNLTGGILNLNGYRIEVQGNCYVESGTLNLGGGAVSCEGNLVVGSNATVYMRNANDYLRVAGNIEWNKYGNGAQCLTKGLIECGGDFCAAAGFVGSDSHRVVFNGTGKQTVFLAEGGKFGIFELKNFSTDGVYTENVFTYDSFIGNDCVFRVGAATGICGFTLKEDMVYDKDLLLVMGAIDLSGHTLTVQGDLIQQGGEVFLNGGQLIVEGDYRIQSRTETEDGFEYGDSTGILKMTEEKESVLVKGNFVSSSTRDETGLLTAGVLEVQGNFTILGCKNTALYSEKSFPASGTHTVKLSGEKRQEVSMRYATDFGSHIQNLELANTGEEGIFFSADDLVCVTGNIKDESNQVTGCIRVEASTTYEDDYFGGSIYMCSGRTMPDNLHIGEDIIFSAESRFATYSIAGKIQVDGNVRLQSFCEINMNRGSLMVGGNMDVATPVNHNGGINMTHEEDYIHVYGDFTHENYYPYLWTAGTLEVGGNFYSKGKLAASNTHRLLLSGEQKQVVLMDDGDYFATIELQNSSEDGVYSDKPFTKNQLITHDTKLTYGDFEGEIGYILTEDTVYEGDFTLLEGVLDLNGYQLTIRGNFTQIAGEVLVHGGSLRIEGDYRMQAGDSKSSGMLTMTDSKDFVHVSGDFITATSVDHTGKLTAGVLEVSGNVKVFATYSDKAFVSTGSHTLRLSGTGQQKVFFEISGPATSGVGTLEITNTSEEGVLFDENDPLYVSSLLNDHGNRSKGYVSIGGSTVVENESFSGDLQIEADRRIEAEHKLNVGGNLRAIRYDSSRVFYLTCNGELQVGGDFIQERVLLQIGTGTVTVDGNYVSCGVGMDNAEGFIHVSGNCTFTADASYMNMSAGVFEVGGDLTVNGGLHATGTNRFIFCGDRLQTIRIADGNYFADVELQNYSEEGVYSETVFARNNLFRNGCRLRYGTLQGEFGDILTEDMVYEGDYCLIDDTLDLNGHKLTVTGDFIHMAGTVKVNGGTLIVEGDYRIQSREKEGESYIYKAGAGKLLMENEDDYVLVKGNFVNESSVNHTGCLKAGTLEIMGDITVSGSASGYNYEDYSFIGTDDFTLQLSGDGIQTVEISHSSEKYSRLANLEITNTTGVRLLGDIYITGNINDHGNPVEGRYTATKGTSFTDNICNHDLFLASGVEIKSPLTVKGNVTACNISISSTLEVEGNYTQIFGSNTQMVEGQLIVHGNYTASGGTYSYNTGISMTHEKDYVHILGNVTYSTYGQTLSDGVYEIGGDLTSYVGIRATNNHKFVFSGETLQTVSLGGDEYFATVELKNYSVDGVCFNGPIIRQKLIRNGCRLTILGEEATIGFTLEEDRVIEGDLFLTEDTIDLNGHSLTVKGNFIQSGGDVLLNGGSLSVEGDYRIQSYTTTGNSMTYGTGSGRLMMVNENDRLKVGGTFSMQTKTFSGGMFTAGTMNLAGDVNIAGNWNFQATGSHTVILDGAGVQTISAGTGNVFQNLFIKNGNQVILGSSLSVIGEVRDEGRSITGTGNVSIKELSQLADNTFSGNLVLTENNVLDSDLWVGGTLYVNASLEGKEYEIQAGRLEISGSLHVQNAQVYCLDSCVIAYRGKIAMQKEAGYMLCGGDFLMHSCVNHRGILTAGTLEIRGNFQQDTATNFVATGSHTVILSGTKTNNGRMFIQEVDFAINPGESRFHRLILKKPDSGYLFHVEKEKIADEILYEIEDIIPPTAITRLEVESVTECSATIQFGGAVDENGISGYEIYRDNTVVAVVNGESYTDRGLKANTEYTYRVYAFDACGNRADSSKSVTAKTLPDTEKPSMVEGIGLKGRTGSSVTLTWNASTDNVGVDYYVLYRDGAVVTDRIYNTTYTDTGLVSGKVYEYRVAAKDYAGNLSEPGECLRTDTFMPQITSIYPDEYEKFFGVVTLGVEFKDCGNSTGNKVKMEYLSPEGDWVAITRTPLSQRRKDAATLYAEYNWDTRLATVTGLFTVRFTVTDKDQNAVSAERTYEIDKTAPKAPGTLEVSGKNGCVLLTWEASQSADCTGYRIYRKGTGEQEFEQISALEGRYADHYTDKEVREGENYVYAVTALDDSGNESTLTLSMELVVPGDEEAPKVLSMEPGSGKINKICSLTVTASDNRKVTSILLYCRVGQEEWTLIGEEPAEEGQSTFGFDTTKYKDGVYEIKAVAYDAAQNGSEDYIKHLEIDNTGISKIRLTEQKAGETMITLRWDEVKEKDLGWFAIEQYTDGKWEEIVIEEKTMGYQLKDLSPDTTYRLRVVGYDSIGNRGEASDEIILKTQADSTGPAILAVYPVSSAYKDTLELSVTAKDNYAVKMASFSYSTDGVNYKIWQTVKNTAYEKETTFRSVMSLKDIPEGDLYVKFEVYDSALNKNLPMKDGSDVIVTYKIDRTAPGSVTDLTVTGNTGYAGLTWNAPKDTDIKCYRIYRADAENGIFRTLEKECITSNYVDTTVSYGNSYIYRMTAVDHAGNEGPYSNNVYVTILQDKDAPVVEAISPFDGDTIGKESTIGVAVTDNAKLSSVRVEYRPLKEENAVWITLAETAVTGRSAYVETDWNAEGLEEGSYRVRALAWDESGNQSTPAYVNYTLDTTPPGPVTLAAENGHFKIHLTISGEHVKEADKQVLKRRKVGEKEFEILCTMDGTTYQDKGVEPYCVYEYRVDSYDAYGNYSSSEIVTAFADNLDVEAPVTVIPELTVGLTDMEIVFDGTQSTDNVRIVRYVWDMGDGETREGPRVNYAYTQPGEYTVKLTTYDAAGNLSEAEGLVYVLERTGMGTAKVQVTTSSGEAIPFASVYVRNGIDDSLLLRADSDGYVTICAKAGFQEVAAYQTNYLPAEKEIYISPYEETTEQIKLVKSELILGGISAHLMTLEEMEEAGVSFSDPANFHTFTYELTLTFERCPLPLIVIVDKEGTTFRPGEMYGAPGELLDFDVHIAPVVERQERKTEDEEKPVFAYLVRQESISWMKNMYDVELGILNAADPQFVLTDCKATLNIPKGLSLASTINGQSQTVEMENIKGQEQANVHWILRGDESTTCKLTAAFQGKLQPFNRDVEAFFESDFELEVTTGEGITIYVMPEENAYIGRKYYIQYAIANGTGHDLINFTTTIGDRQDPKIEQTLIDPYTGTEYTTITGTCTVENAGELGQTLVCDGGIQLEIKNFKAGDVFYGTYSTFFDVEDDPSQYYYKLVDTFVETLEGENLGVEVVVMPIPSHIFRGYVIVQTTETEYADPVDMTTGYFKESVTTLELAGASVIGAGLSYDSGLSSIQGKAGYGWRTEYDQYLEEHNGLIQYYAAPGEGTFFIHDNAMKHINYGTIKSGSVYLDSGNAYSQGNYHAIGDMFSDYTLTKNRDNTYTLSYPAGKTYFDEQGRLTGFEDEEGKRILITQGENLVTVTEPISGKKLYLHYAESGLLQSVTDDYGRESTLHYDDRGYLVSVMSPYGNRVFTYDSDGRISGAANAQGVYARNVYDEQGRVLTQTDALGGKTTFSYQTAGGNKTVTITDSRGVEKKVFINSAGLISKKILEDGSVVKYTYDAKGHLTGQTDQAGNRTKYTYDKAGNMTELIVADGEKVISTYDSKGNITSISDGRSMTATYAYDDHNRMTSYTTASGRVTTYAYDNNGQLIKESVSGIGSMEYTYEKGLPVTVKDYEGNVSKLYYDALGRRIKTENALGEITETTYDEAGNVLSVTDALGNRIRYTYDGNGNVTSFTDALGNRTAYAYDALGRQTRITYADGTET